MNTATLKDFINPSQLSTMVANTKGEEGEFFIEKIEELNNTINKMGGYGSQDGKGNDAIVYLHYFYGGFDWYITEKDTVEGEPQLQAFGYADMGFPELGIIGRVNPLADSMPAVAPNNTTG